MNESRLEFKNIIELFKCIFNDFPIATILYSPEGILLNVNLACINLFHISKISDIKNFDIYENLYISENVKETLLNGKSAIFEFLFDFDKLHENFKVNRSGIAYFEIIIHPIYLSSKESKHYHIVYLRDITESRLTEESLIRSEKKYKEGFDQAILYKDIFLHNMNNLLFNIQMASELCSLFLNDENKIENIRENLRIIQDQINQGRKSILNIQKLSQIGKSESYFKYIKLYSVLEKSIDFLKKSYPNRRINIIIHKEDDNITIKANELLADVFENILINAVRHNNNQEVEIIIQVSEIHENSEKFIKIEFIDNGIGITNNMKELIFYERKEKTLVKKGMGIGLTLVKKIIDLFKGKIWVENKVKGDYSKGSNFIILLPSSI